jgi:hypothetical protein
MLVLHHDHELAGLGRLGHLRMADLQQVGDVGEVRARNDFEIGHGCLWACGSPMAWLLAGCTGSHVKAQSRAMSVRAA